MRELRAILLDVIGVMNEAVLPVELCIQELTAILRDADADADLGGLLVAWESVCMGAVLPSDRIISSIDGLSVGHPLTGADARKEAALRLANVRGKVTASDLRQVAPGWSSESYRQTFRDLVEAGELVKVGERKLTHYVPNDGDTLA